FFGSVGQLAGPDFVLDGLEDGGAAQLAVVFAGGLHDLDEEVGAVEGEAGGGGAGVEAAPGFEGVDEGEGGFGGPAGDLVDDVVGGGAGQLVPFADPAEAVGDDEGAEANFVRLLDEGGEGGGGGAGAGDEVYFL